MPACKSRLPAPCARRLLERFAAALCALLQQWISAAARAAGSRRRAARWRWLCLVLPPACFRPGCYAAAGAQQVLSRVAQPPSIARRALDRFYGVTILPSAWPETLKESVQRAQPAAHLVPLGADGAKARSPKRSDGSLRGPTGELKLLAAQHEAGATWPSGRVDRSADCCADRVPLRLPLVRGLGGELKQWPRAQLAEAACG